MFTKMLKPLTLSFLLTAVCIGIAMWATPPGLAGDNEKCSGQGVSVTDRKSCSDYNESDCNDSQGYTNRTSDWSCVAAEGKHCEIWQKEKAYSTHVWDCELKESGSCGPVPGSAEYSGDKLDACNTTDM